MPELCFRGTELGLDNNGIISFPKALDRWERFINKHGLTQMKKKCINLNPLCEKLQRDKATSTCRVPSVGQVLFKWFGHWIQWLSGSFWKDHPSWSLQSTWGLVGGVGGGRETIRPSVAGICVKCCHYPRSTGPQKLCASQGRGGVGKRRGRLSLPQLVMWKRTYTCTK